MNKVESTLWSRGVCRSGAVAFLTVVVAAATMIFAISSSRAQDSEEDLLSGMEGESLTDMKEDTPVAPNQEVIAKKKMSGSSGELSSVVGQIERMKISEDQLLEFMKQGGLKSRVLK